MAHLIETIRETSVLDAMEQLKNTHALIVEQAVFTQRHLSTSHDSWGLQLKRLEVSLPSGVALIGKKSEKFTEVVNILATLERTIAALEWLLVKHPTGFVRECHASTSDDIDGNDIVLVEHISGEVIVRCEVTDVISDKAGQNGKEKKDLNSLGCSSTVPTDGVIRYIATSPEFAKALTSQKRKWSRLHYRYICYQCISQNQTILLEITNSPSTY